MRSTFSIRQRKKKKKYLQRQRLFYLLTFIFLAVVAVAGVRFLGSFQALQNKADWAKSLHRASQDAGTNYLLYGLEGNNGKATVEDLFFINFPATGAPFHTVFIPGKVLLHHLDNENGTNFTVGNNDGEEEVQSFYTPSHFYNEGGAELLVQQLALFFDAPVHHYLEINYGGVSALADTQEGIVSRGDALKGRDYYNYFKQGQAEDKPLENALHRFGFLDDLLKVLVEKKGKMALYHTITKVSPYLKTDLSWKELQDFQVTLEPFFDAPDQVIPLPGDWRDFDGELYLEPDHAQLAALCKGLGENFILPRELVTVEILNGCGVAGIATQVGEILEREGFQVVKIDNADNFEYQRCQVISRLEQVEPAKDVAQFIPDAEFFKEHLPDHPAMVTVIVGNNFSP
jgi:hypothetical protein